MLEIVSEDAFDLQRNDALTDAASPGAALPKWPQPPGRASSSSSLGSRSSVSKQLLGPAGAHAPKFCHCVCIVDKKWLKSCRPLPLPDEENGGQVCVLLEQEEARLLSRQ